MHTNIQWKAVYDDGKELPQVNEDGSENKYPDIDRSKLAFFEIYKEEKLIFRLHFQEGRRLIYRRRVSVNAMTKETHAIYLVGWQAIVGGRNVQDIAYIFEDGHVELAGQWKEGRVFYAPILINEEKGPQLKVSLWKPLLDFLKMILKGVASKAGD